ncbi:MAG: MBL fold metallo-hydrolase [Candidatus Cloacimonadota bacterium]|nr:MAG: MBL fold metallo-hydrolase [Candidatus Cloacimonadota bacterium]
MRIKRFILLEEFQTNTYLVWDERTKYSIIIDPADKANVIIENIKEENLCLKYIINTHGHADHIGANAELKEKTNAKIIIHPEDKDMLIDPQKNLSAFFDQNIVSAPADMLVNDKEIITFGSYELEVIHTPGHTKGGISLYCKDANLLFTGDTLFFEGIGRTDIYGGNFNVLKNSIIEKLFSLPENTIVYPGHGAKTFIKHEKKYNPYVGLLKMTDYLSP